MRCEVDIEAGWLHKFLFWVLTKGVKPLYGKGIGTRFPLVRRAFTFLLCVFSRGLTLTKVEGIKLYLNPKSSLTSVLMMDGSYEKGTTRILRDLIKEGMVVLDIGANVGYYSLIAARLVGEKGTVFAFEPAPDNFAFLEKNIKVNNFTNIISVQKAVSNQTGRGRLFLSNQPDFHSMHERHEKGSIEVEVTSVDEFMKSINRPVDLVKMDVEGSEMRALEGMLETIRRSPSLKIITEFYPDEIEKSGCSPEGFLQKLTGCGFKLYLIDEETGATKPAEVRSIVEVGQRRNVFNLYCDRQR